MIVVVSLSVLADIGFCSVLPPQTMGSMNVKSLRLVKPYLTCLFRILKFFGKAIFGRADIFIHTWIVCLSCLGALNATIFSVGRLTESAGARQNLPTISRTAKSLRRDHVLKDQNLNSLSAGSVQAIKPLSPTKTQAIPRWVTSSEPPARLQVSIGTNLNNNSWQERNAVECCLELLICPDR